ncbi:MAG: polyphosphate kinase 2 [Saprospiraceae bacterium]
MSKKNKALKINQLEKLETKSDLLELLKSRGKAGEKIAKTIAYEQELIGLQIELGKLQNWVKENGKRVAIIFEGRDAAGKGGTIRRFTQHLNPREMQIVALPKPTDAEKNQWYFRRYIKKLPNAGEIVFFDRSWYNRAVVEPVNGFCTENQYELFMKQVIDFENMLHEDGLILIKFWLEIDKEEQQERFEARRENPLKQWKLSPIDAKAQELWDTYSHYRDAMFKNTNSNHTPWVVVEANSKKTARLESIKYVLSQINYRTDTDTNIEFDEKIVAPYSE